MEQTGIEAVLVDVKILHTTDQSKLDMRRGRILLARGNQTHQWRRVRIGCLKPELGPDRSLALSKDQYLGENRKLKATEICFVRDQKTVVSCIRMCAMYYILYLYTGHSETGIAYVPTVQYICHKWCSRVHPRARIVWNGQKQIGGRARSLVEIFSQAWCAYLLYLGFDCNVSICMGVVGSVLVPTAEMQSQNYLSAECDGYRISEFWETTTTMETAMWRSRWSISKNTDNTRGK